MGMNEMIAEFQRQAGFAVATAKQAAQDARTMQGKYALFEQRLERQEKDFAELAAALRDVRGARIGSGNVPHNLDIRLIEQIPGRRIPFDLIATIPFGAAVASEQQATQQITQDGPFVAVARYAVFQSAHEVLYTDPETGAQVTFKGRSYGRYRPIHSMWDLGDAGGAFQPTIGAAIPGTGAPLIASPSNFSSFRTMEFDGVITFLNAGSGYPRSNAPVPSALYTTQVNAPFQLGALDFFERGESLQWKVTPTHLPNPPFGNLAGYAAGGVYPFLASQYDVQEGIADPALQGVTTDPITRQPNGFLIVGLHGFRIIQPPGPVRLT